MAARLRFPLAGLAAMAIVAAGCGASAGSPLPEVTQTAQTAQTATPTARPTAEPTDRNGKPPKPAQASSQPGQASSQPRQPEQSAKPSAQGSGAAAGPAYNIDQAISDRAQENTIAFDALGFLTGTIGSDICATTTRARWATTRTS